MRGGRQSTMWMVGAALTAVLTVSGCAKMEKMENRMGAAADSSMLTLSGAQEVPPVNTQASGRSSIAVIGDKVITGRVELSSINATAAHIHMGASGQNGPVIIPLVKTADNVWSDSREHDAVERPVRRLSGGESLRQRAQRGQSGRRDSRSAEAVARRARLPTSVESHLDARGASGHDPC